MLARPVHSLAPSTIRTLRSLAMMFHMRLRRFRRMMRRLVLVPIRKMRMVSRYMMLAIFMLPRRLSKLETRQVPRVPAAKLPAGM